MGELGWSKQTRFDVAALLVQNVCTLLSSCIDIAFIVVNVYFALLLSPQMFIFDKVGEGGISTHQFEITGSTYAPEGEM